MPATRNQVAALAHVSSATVSRVFNNPGTVSPQLRDAVLEAARQLGYTPNKAAGMLRRRGTGVIAFVELEKEPRPYYWGNLRSFDWFFGRALRGIQEAVKHTSWQLRFHTVSCKEDLERLAGQCDGILAYDVDTKAEAELFSGLSVPYVLSHHLEDCPDEHCVYTDNYLGGILQGKFLEKTGASKPLYVTGYTESVASHRNRLDGFRSVFPDAVVLSAKIGSENAMDPLVPLVREQVERGKIDSLAAVNDLALYELLLKVPCSIPSVGYDASPFYRLFSGPVASVDIRSDELYRTACSHLISLLNGAPARRIVVEPVLTVVNPQT
jgi:LacI family transcriptional regulator